MLGIGAHRALAIATLGDHRRPRAFEQEAEAKADQGMIVGNQNAPVVQQVLGAHCSVSARCCSKS